MARNRENITAAKIITTGAIVAAVIGAVALYLVNTPKGIVSDSIREIGNILPNFGRIEQRTIITISIGDFRHVELRGHRTLRISVLDIRSASFLSPFKSPRDVLGAEIDLDTGGGLVYGGEYTIKTGVNMYLLQQFNAQDEEPYSVFSYHIHDDSFNFLRVFVEHINPYSKEVTLNIFTFE